jgi:hypothetical protein
MTRPDDVVSRVRRRFVAVVAVGGVLGAVALAVGHRSNTEAEPSPISGQIQTVEPSSSVVSEAPGRSSSAAEQSASQIAASALAAPTTVTTSVPDDPQGVLRLQVISAYLAFERTLNRQLAVVSSDMIPLQGVATGQVLASSDSAIAELRGKGEVQRGNPIFTNVVVTSLSSSTTAAVCATEDDGPTAIVDVKTGVVVASGFPRYISRTVMVLDGRTWKAATASSAEAC